MGYVISMMVLATIALFSVFYIFRDQDRKHSNSKM